MKTQIKSSLWSCMQLWLLGCIQNRFWHAFYEHPYKSLSFYVSCMDPSHCPNDRSRCEHNFTVTGQNFSKLQDLSISQQSESCAHYQGTNQVFLWNIYRWSDWFMRLEAAVRSSIQVYNVVSWRCQMQIPRRTMELPRDVWHKVHWKHWLRETES